MIGKEEIRIILMDIWDPIGVKDEPGAQDEYDAYIPKIYNMLVAEASTQKITKYLKWVEMEKMGFKPNKVPMMRIYDSDIEAQDFLKACEVHQ